MGNCTTTSSLFTIYHPTLGTLQISFQKQSTFMIANIPVTDLQTYEHWTQKLSNLTATSPKEYILIPQHKQYIQPTLLCNSHPTIKITFEYCYQTVSQVIEKKRNLNETYKEKEIFYIAYVLAQVGKYFEKMGQKIGNVSPVNLIYNQSKQLKLITTYSIPNTTDILLSTLTPQQHTLLSPQEIDFYSAITLKKINIAKSDSFRIGLTLLQCATLFDCSKLYTTKGKIIYLNWPELEKQLKNLEKRYSVQLYKLIKQLLNPNPQHRLSSTEVTKMFQKKQPQILNQNELQESFKNISFDSLSDSIIKAQTQRNQGILFNTSNVSSKQINQNQKMKRLNRGYDYGINTY